jgi:hypothetical protein
MAAMRPMTIREKVILIVTITLIICLGVYYGFLGDFVLDYQSTNEQIARAQKNRKVQLSLLAKGDAIDAKYRTIEATLPKAEEGRTPQALFTSEIVKFCGAPTPSLDPHDVAPVPEADEFAYLIINIERLEGNLERIVKVLKAINERNLLVQALNLRPTKQVESPSLELSVEIAQLVRVTDLERSDQREIKKQLDR